MAVPGRVVLAVLVAYVVTGLAYGAGMTYAVNAFTDWPFFSPRPWSSASTFVGWFAGQAVSWPSRLFPIRGLWELVVPTVFLVTLWLFYLATRGRSVRVEQRRLS